MNHLDLSLGSRLPSLSCLLPPTATTGPHTQTEPNSDASETTCLFHPMFLNTGPSNHTAVFQTVPSPLASVNQFTIFIMALSQAIPTLL